LAQLEIRQNESNQTENNVQLFKNSIISLLKNRNYLLILISYGINVGAFYAISTLLNPIISEYYEVRIFAFQDIHFQSIFLYEIY